MLRTKSSWAGSGRSNWHAAARLYRARSGSDSGPADPIGCPATRRTLGPWSVARRSRRPEAGRRRPGCGVRVRPLRPAMDATERRLARSSPTSTRSRRPSARPSWSTFSAPPAMPRPPGSSSSARMTPRAPTTPQMKRPTPRRTRLPPTRPFARAVMGRRSRRCRTSSARPSRPADPSRPMGASAQPRPGASASSSAPAG